MDWKYVDVSNKVYEGNSYIQLRIAYKWDNANKTNRTIKVYMKLVLVENWYYLQVDNTSANRTNNLRGLNLGIQIDDGSIVKCNSIWQSSNSQGASKSYDLCSTSKIVSYADNGVAVANLKYDLYLRWMDIYTAGIHYIDAKSSYKITNLPTIDPKYITSFTATADSTNITIKPSKINFSNTTNNSVELGKYETYQTITKSAEISDYASTPVKITINGTPADGVGELTVTSTNTDIIGLPGQISNGTITNNQLTINYPNSKSFSVIAKKPGTASINIYYKKENLTRTIKFTVSSNNTIDWTVDKTDLISITKPSGYSTNTRLISPKAGTNGTAVVTVKSNSNSSAKTTLTIKSHLAPTGQTITTDKNSIYPGEKLKITTTLNPYNSSNSSKCVSTKYAKSNCTIVANNSATGSTLKTSNYTSNPYNMEFTLAPNTSVKNNSITVVLAPTYSESSSTKVIPIKNPTISVSPSVLSLKPGESKSFTVTTTPANTDFTVSSSSSGYTTKKSGNVVTVTSTSVSEESTITVKSKAALLNGMPVPQANVRLSTQPKHLTSLKLVAYSSEYNKLSKYTKILKPTNFTVSPTSVELTNKGTLSDSQQINTDYAFKPESAMDLLLDGEPSTGCVYDISVTSSNPDVADLNFWEWDDNGNKININKVVWDGSKTSTDGLDASEVDCALTIVYKKAGNTIITAKDSVSGLSSSVELTVKTDGTIAWSSANTAIATVKNGKITAKSGINGATKVTAKCGSCSRTINVENHLLPSGIDIKTDKTENYKYSETPKFTVQILPNTGTASTSVTKSSKYITSKYTLTASDTNKVVVQGSNNTSKYTYSGYTLKNTDLTSSYTFNVTLDSLSASKSISLNSAIQNFEIKNNSVNISLQPLSVRLSTTSAESAADYNEISNLTNQTQTVKSNSNGTFWTTMFFTSASHTVPIKWKPTKVMDEFTVESNNTSVIGSFVTDGVFQSSAINATNRNGAFDLKFTAFKAGKARITLKSVTNPKVTGYIDCTVTENRDIIIDNSDSKIVDKLTKIEDKSGIQKWSYHTSSTTNGSSTLLVKSKENTNKNISLNIKNLLTPSNLKIKLHNTAGSVFDKSDNNIEAYINDKIEYIIMEEPSSTNDSGTVASNFRYAEYSITTDVSGQPLVLDSTDRKSSNVRLELASGKLQYKGSYVIPEKSGKTINISSVAVSASSKNASNYEKFNSASNMASITIVDPTLEIGLTSTDFKDSQTIILSTAQDSKQNVYVKTVPSSASYTYKPTVNSTSIEGYIVSPTIDKQGNKVLVFTGNRRNIDANSKLTTLYADNPESNNQIKYNEIKVEYNGIKRTKLQNPSALIRVYTGEHYGYPKILNSVTESGSEHLYYYGNTPKIIIELPKQNDFSFLKNIEVALDNGTGKTYYISNDTKQANYYSIYYNPDCSIDYINGYDASKLINESIFNHENYNYCVFSPAVEDMKNCTSIKVTYKSYRSSVPDASTKITLHRMSPLTLPKVGDPLALAPLQDYLTTISTIVKPYLTNGLIDGKLYTLSSFFYGLILSTNGVLSTDSLGKKAKKSDNTFNEVNTIRALPFFKLLFGLNRILIKLNDITTYGGHFVARDTENLPNLLNTLSCNPVRNMFVNNTMIKNWYETYVLESSKQFNESDKRLYDDFLKLYDIQLNSDFNLTEDSYPVMVDDSKNTIGENRLINNYKDTPLYNDYTISPLSEIIKALEQL